MQTKTRFTRSTVAAALIAAFAAVSGTAIAGTDTDNLSVSATVTASCTVDSTTEVAFGTYDPVADNASTGIDLTTSSGAIATTCTNGSSATITLGQGANSDTGSTDTAPLRRMVGATNTDEYLSYSLCQDSTACATVWGNDAGTGQVVTGTGASDSVVVYGSAPKGQNVKADTYSDTVLVTVTF
ncbi:hypothetical protein UU9_16351 [Rhodanobacter fulvus Jip2]|uniref:Spore coat protein U/FanG domain-containing protein n=1 Tax=Rhodanobacter fulvus Jip2 TaxID=1163408 RepID=I4VJH3_9GAMM|nr:spore coat protein U domain-containing protein [Rhodanobacter fulvus]EIL87364.1 hypothetical protein UU9_16351 [Rhodanobacter fulvus Jip2]